MKATLILAAALAATSASAEFMTGNELLSRINSETNYERGTAIGYIMGAFDAGQGTTHCAPANVTAGQVRDMVRNVLTAAPAARHHSADSFVSYALMEAWPCKKRERGTNL